MEPLIHTISAWDGLRLCVREWPGDPARAPLLCLPGIVRVGADFEGLAAARAGRNRIVAIDYAGRGDSGRSLPVSRYGPEACVRDIMDITAALHVRRAVAIGTSFGGLLALGLATARPGLLQGVVLNDIGPDIGAQGDAFV